MMTFGQAVKELEMTYPGTDKPVTAGALLEILKRYVIMAVERPGSWQGSHMYDLLRNNGFWLTKPD